MNTLKSQNVNSHSIVKVTPNAIIFITMFKTIVILCLVSECYQIIKKIIEPKCGVLYKTSILHIYTIYQCFQRYMFINYMYFVVIMSRND